MAGFGRYYDNPSANDVISMALDALLEGVYPKAKGFVNK